MFTGNPLADFFQFPEDRLTPVAETVSAITRIKSQVASYNNTLLQNNRFLMMITAPASVRYNLGAPDSEEEDFIGNGVATNSGNLLPFMCFKVNLPGVQFGSRDVLPSGYGMTTKMPYTQSFGPLTPSFFVDQNLAAFNFFTKWMQSIINFGGNQALNAPSTVNGAQMFDVSYKDDYTTTIDIYVYNNTSESIIQYKFYNAFPVAMGDVDLSWDFNNELMTLPVTLVYDYWTSNFIKPATGYNYTNPGLNYFNSLFPSGLQGYSSDAGYNNQRYRDTANIISTFATKTPLSRFRNGNL